MAAQPTVTRKSRSHLDSEDAFTARAIEFSGWARTNIRLIVGGVVALALLVGGLLYYRTYQADREARAATEFMRVQQTASTGNVALATRDLEAYVRRYEGTPPGDEARVVLGQLYLSENEPAKAETLLAGAGAWIDDSPVGAPAALLLAAAQQATGKTDQAIETYLRVSREADLKMYRVQALQNAALLQVDKGDFAAAATLYRELVGMHEEDSLDRQAAEMRLAEVEARAAAS